MPSTRLLKTKDGKPFYEITVSRGRSKGKLTKRWYPPDGWSKRSIERELAAVAAEFERECDSGKIVSRAEQREREAKQAEKEARILTLKQYGETVIHACQDRHDERERQKQLSGYSEPAHLSCAGGEKAAEHHTCTDFGAAAQYAD